jgi:preprotein translocase subunit SecG
MSIIISILLIIEVLAAFFLVVVILAQKSKDQGLGMAFGGGMGESLFGSRAGNVLTRMTVTLAAVFMLTTIVLGVLFAQGKSGSGSVMDKADRQMPMAPAAGLPPPAASQPTMPAPQMEGEAPIASVEASTPEAAAPVMLQMGEAGELAPAAEEAVVPVAEEAAVAVEAPAAPAPETTPAP